jgi:uncharacterized membrane protein YedE/YeeE
MMMVMAVVMMVVIVMAVVMMMAVVMVMVMVMAMVRALRRQLCGDYTHLRQHTSPPGFAKLSPLWGGAGFYFGFTFAYLCASAHLLVSVPRRLHRSIPLSIDTDR